MDMPLRPSDHFSRLVIFDIEPMTRRIGAVPLPLPYFAFLNHSGAICGGGAEHGEEYLHERVVWLVIASQLAVDYMRECGLVRAFFDCERHGCEIVWRISRDEAVENGSMKGVPKQEGNK